MKQPWVKERHQWILEQRQARKLHAAVEDRLTKLVSKIAPDYHPIKEPVGLAGGRNDLMLFEFSGRKILFEIFATRSQVSRDLRILDKTDADVKIAIIIDKEVDASVFEAFVKESPEDNYPFLFIGELFEEPPVICTLKLRELILGDEEAKFLRMLQAKIPKEDFFSVCRKEGIEVLIRDDIQSGNITFVKVFTTLVLDKCLKYGVAKDRVKNLGQWLSNEGLMKHILRKVSAGMNVILFTDFVENFSVYGDMELADWIRATYLFPQPFVIMSLNAVISEIDEKYLKGDKKILAGQEPQIYLGSSQVYETKRGRMVVCSLPKETNSIIVLPPMSNAKDPNDYRQMIQVMPSGPVLFKLSSDEHEA
ncbi:MAG: hypothetical protein AB1791_03440 [Chloroflexota bacterium]